MSEKGLEGYSRCIVQALHTPENEKIVVTPELSEAYTQLANELFSKPWLAHPYTRKLVEELTARIERERDAERRGISREVEEE